MKPSPEQQRRARLDKGLALVDRYNRHEAANEATALMAIEGALDPLSFDARRRMLIWAAARFRIRVEIEQ